MSSLPLNFIHLPTTDSTNTWAKQHLSEFPKDALTCITAQKQTGGKGRGTKTWFSPPDVNVYATFVFFVPKGFPYLHNAGQVLATSCVRTLQEYDLSPCIKWPNDILVSGKKIAGILTEVVDRKDNFAVIIGIGVNVNMTPEQLATIDQPATSLLDLKGHHFHPQDIATVLSQTLSHDIAKFLISGFRSFYAFYNDFLARKGEKIQVKDGEKVLIGICVGIDPEGRLLLELDPKNTYSISQPLKLTSGELIL